jgi:hypothetical protein
MQVFEHGHIGPKKLEEKVQKANDRQVGGTHYGSGDMPQHWDLVAQYGWDYFQGQITKYLMRWRKKNGVEDLEKAAHYLQKYIELERGKAEAARKSGQGGIPGPQGEIQKD